ncbi:type VII secretion target [Nocardia flavorosea]|uniref:ESX-1 secretion-associated protein n=1 Tax=Nocardia flavorosea TaxID=53429 RepID=A0A846YPI6_9NOCA|nr:type VII secretion target [Nocardia flavorosea]NKY59312.1 ESX-1 secretion-associated protein [Nocardia flavorosea]
MSNTSVETEALRVFGTTNAGIGTEIAGVATMDAVRDAAALAPVFGLIGADYLAMFAAAQVLQTRDINDLAAKYQHLSQAAFSSALNYDITDDGTAGALGAAGGAL